MKNDELDFIENLFENIKIYLKDLENPNLKPKIHQDPDELKSKFDFTLDEPNTLQEINSYLERYLNLSARTSSKQFHNQLFAGYSAPALAGEFITSVVNGSNYTYEVSPLGTLMELELLKKMASYVGFEKYSGTFLTGGSNANMIAMIAARQSKFPEVKTKGVSGIGELCIFVSEECHYSFEKSANAIGIGLNNVFRIKTKNGEIDSQDLEEQIVKSKEMGKTPYFVGATAGTTERGAFDPVEEMSAICKKYNLWLHIDAAWGGSILLSEKYRSLLGDVELGDSFSWDPHKMMNIPLICSVLLINNEKLLYETVGSENTDYIFHKHSNDAYDIGRSSIQCGKRVDSLKLWAAWKYYGDKGLACRIDKLFENKDYVIHYIEKSDDLELLCDAPSMNINFRFIDNDVIDIDLYNRKIREKLMDLGESLCNICYINGKLSIRLIVNNPEKDFSDFKIFFDNLRNAKNLVKLEYSAIGTDN